MVKIFTDEMVKFLKENIVGKTSIETTNLLNEKFGTQFTDSQIKNFKCRNKIPSELGGSFGRFKSGMTPWNKGKKMPDEVKEKIKKTKTMFEVGHVPHQTLPLGTERYDKDGYIEVKVKASDYETAGNRGKCSRFDTKWIGKHKKVWIDNFGDTIPPQHKIIFLDKNKYNFDVSNLACISNGQHAVMCKKQRYTEFSEVTSANLLLTELEKKVKTYAN